jgi:ribosomal 50S subunit-associated protein YjgA (DUF615 family)
MRSLADRLHQQALAAADDRDLTSRTDRRRREQKREQQLKAMAIRLVSLRPQLRERLALGEELVAAIELCRAISSPKAKNRQVGVVRQHLRDLGAEIEKLERLLGPE